MTDSGLPLVVTPQRRWTAAEVFASLRHLPGRLWLDSALPAHAPPPDGNSADGSSADGSSAEGSSGDGLGVATSPLGRYSFVTADPVARFVRNLPPAAARRGFRQIEGDDPWTELSHWAARLPANNRPDLPPFQGGIAGLLGYEAAAWLEHVGVAAIDDLPTDTISLGLYDVVFAVDHLTDQTWLISQGYDAAMRRDRDRARRRADAFLRLLHAPPAGADGEDTLAATAVADDPPRGTAPPIQPVSNFTAADFTAAVDDVIRRICRGDSFQVNLAQRLTTPAVVPPDRLYAQLRRCNAAPFAAFYDGGPFQVLSSSPEGFLQVRDRRVQTRPIKGTVPRTGDADVDLRHARSLHDSEKDRAENVMIVDLMRNDLSRVCDDDSVVVDRLCELEPYRYVQHLVSVVSGRLRDDVGIVDLLKAAFPGGSVTGAPKIEAMRTIATLEPHRRGPYCGSIGYLSAADTADFNILIRTITAAGGWWQFPVGGGITARSNPAAELAETWTKAAGMLAAIRATPTGR